MNELKEYLEQYPEAKILDIGTGKGDFINLIDYLYHDYSEIIGVDIIDYLLEMDKDSFKGNPKIKFINEDILNPTFPKNSFDIISLSSTFHHLTDIEETLKHMTTLLKPGGIIIISELISDNLDKKQVSHELLHHFAAKIVREIGMIHSQTCDKKGILKAVKKYAPIPVVDYWDMTIKDLYLDVEMSTLYQIIDQLLENVKDSEQYKVFKKEADEIKLYLKENGFQLANKLCIVLKKNKE
ncbi:MAG: methyltransferase domain-containing protein [Candidatus Izimaplasma sp.]|nr:methyltransferase domain-containing protein [Candidatus Izimaplasma bacterium]